MRSEGEAVSQGPGNGRVPLRRCVHALVATLALLAWTPGCTWEGPAPEVGDGREVHLTLLHTADWHSRLLPYDMNVGVVDQNLGLLPGNAPFGGAARMVHLLQRERGRSGRVLHLDSGDVFQGAPIFNFFRGEAEMRALSLSGVDAMVVGNHEFDAGGENFARQIERWASFPVLAANYRFEALDPAIDDLPRLARLVEPYVVLDAEGLRVGVIGLGNLSSLSSIFQQPNRLGIVPLETVQVTQFYVDFLRPRVDVVVLLTHSGVTADERMIRNTSGIDVVLGGHLHVVLDPPKVVEDCAHVDEQGRHYIEIDNGEDPAAPPIRRYCRPRRVVLAHSGAFMKYLGRLDLVLSKDPDVVQPVVPDEAARFPELRYTPELDGYEVVSHAYQLFPVDATVPEDPRVAEMLVPYEQQLIRLKDLDLLVGYAPQVVRRFGARNGDSPLGNLIADSMWLRLGVETDFALTNTTGIRTDLTPGPVSVEQLYNVFPFDNSIATMFLSGVEVKEMFDYVARRSAQRGCQSQAQIAGARVVLDCSGSSPACGGEPCAEKIAIGRTETPCERDADCGEGLCDARPDLPPSQWRCLLPLERDASYELATSDYLAGGGSGFRVLERNTTTVKTGLPMREVLSDYLRNGMPCGADPDTGLLPSCGTDADCPAEMVCACPQRVRYDEASGRCIGPDDGESCAPGAGQCVLRACRDDVARYRVERSCAEAIDEAQRARCECDALSDAGEECKFLACIDARLGAVTDGRITVRSF